LLPGLIPDRELKTEAIEECDPRIGVEIGTGRSDGAVSGECAGASATAYGEPFAPSSCACCAFRGLSSGQWLQFLVYFFSEVIFVSPMLWRVTRKLA